MRPLAPLVLVVAASLPACAIDWDRYLATPQDGGPAPRDTGTTLPRDTGGNPPVDTGLPPVDTGITPPADTGITPPADTGGGTSTNCPLPYLAVSVEDVSNTSSARGRVLRLPLTGGAPACTPLTTTGAQPMALAVAPQLGLVVATRDGVEIFDPVTGAVRDNIPIGTVRSTVPMDVFALNYQSRPGVAVAWANPGTSGTLAGEIVVIEGGVVRETWTTTNFASDFRSVTRHPFDANRYAGLRSIGETRAVTPQTPPARHVLDPLTNDTRTNLTSMHVYWVNNRPRVSWTVGGGVYANSPATTTGTITYGNLRMRGCAGQCPTALRGAAAPDESGEAFALCEMSTRYQERQVVRFGPSDGSCLIFDAAQGLTSQQRMSNLTVVTD